jgi:phosphopantetheinyl transferase
LVDWQNRVKRFVFEADRKRALVGRLAMYSLCHEILGTPVQQCGTVVIFASLGLPFEKIDLRRSSEKKPYLVTRHLLAASLTYLQHSYPADCRFYNWNFNMSHHGDFVCCLETIGTDCILTGHYRCGAGAAGRR